MPDRVFEPEDNQTVPDSEKRRKKEDFENVRTPLQKLKADDYTVGWICAIMVEYVAAQEFSLAKSMRGQSMCPLKMTTIMHWAASGNTM